jgi:hypothetical protein
MWPEGGHAALVAACISEAASSALATERRLFGFDDIQTEGRGTILEFALDSTSKQRRTNNGGRTRSLIHHPTKAQLPFPIRPNGSVDLVK